MEGDILRGLIYQFVDYYGIQEGSCKNKSNASNKASIIKDKIGVSRTGWIGPWIPGPIQEPVKEYSILYFNFDKKLGANSKH